MVIRIFLIIVISFICKTGSAQIHYEVTYANDGIFVPESKYSSKIILRRFRQRLLFNENLSFFYILWKDTDPLKKQKIDSFQLNNSLYYDDRDKKLYTLRIMPRDVGSFLIADSLKAENWIFTNQEKKIKGFKCKMVYKPINDKDTVTVWFTPEIPYSFGPSNYVGFPGLVLEVHDPMTRTRMMAVEIKDKPVNIYFPSDRIISRREFHTLYE